MGTVASAVGTLTVFIGSLRSVQRPDVTGNAARTPGNVSCWPCPAGGRQSTSLCGRDLRMLVEPDTELNRFDLGGSPPWCCPRCLGPRAGDAHGQVPLGGHFAFPSHTSSPGEKLDTVRIPLDLLSAYPLHPA